MKTLKEQIIERLLDYLDLRKFIIIDQNDLKVQKKVEATLQDVFNEFSSQMPDLNLRNKLYEEVLNEVLGFGPLQDFINDPEVVEIMVNNARQIYIEKNGKLQLTDKQFSSDEAVRNIIERIVAPLGRRIDESSPMVDARLADGSRVHAIIPPLSLQGPMLTIRKFLPTVFSLEDLLKFDSISAAMGEFLRYCVQLRANIIASGKTSSGKTTLLNILSSFIPLDERIITIEDSAELKMNQAHVCRLEYRPPNLEGKGEVTIRELLRNSLRMRPDRIIVGECRGVETLDMTQAMNTGHDGSLSTAHANSPLDLLHRLETMALTGNVTMPASTLRRQIASAIQFIVHTTRFADGSRKVTEIDELLGLDDDQYILQKIFTFRQTGLRIGGKVEGYYEATGVIPRFFIEAEREGYQIPMDLFSPST
ncbi:CpaF family protein [candidate division CSSED10-310 bacterium]|uniref:CpaF family protein n=1 Tax=candidate division CSSED10-310 bacterium TaxID=2855610 RepID=A0ABV6Z2Y0_UNCC1